MDRLKKAIVESQKLGEAKDFNASEFNIFKGKVEQAFEKARQDLGKIANGSVPGAEVAETLHADLEDVLGQLEKCF